MVCNAEHLSLISNQTVGKKNLIPDDLFGKKGRHCIEKAIVSHVSKVMHHPISITVNDFGDCYDRSARTIQSVALRAHEIPSAAVRMMLTSLKTMQFFLRTGFGELE